MPAGASPGLAKGSMAVRPSGAATTVYAPLSTTTWPQAVACDCATATRSACTSLTVHPISLAISPGCGVKMLTGGSRFGQSSIPARMFSPSASTTRGGNAGGSVSPSLVPTNPRRLRPPTPPNNVSTKAAVSRSHPRPGPSSSASYSSNRSANTWAALAAMLPSSWGSNR